MDQSVIAPIPAGTLRARLRDWAKTLVTFLLCAGFVTYAFMVMFGMPAGAQ